MSSDESPPVDQSSSSFSEEVVIHLGKLSAVNEVPLTSKCRRLSLVSNYISKIEDLEECTELEELELYQNKIGRLENISHLSKLRALDLSFNSIRHIEGIESLVNLEKLYLTANLIGKIDCLQSLTKLRILELGNNKIRTIENLDQCTALIELWLGKNKITELTVPKLPALLQLSLQANRLRDWGDGTLFSNCPQLQGLYLSENKLPNPPEQLTNLTMLQTLDLAKNCISELHVIGTISSLTDLWLNDNQIQDLKELQHLKNLTNLSTLYLHDNPLQDKLGPGYRQAVLQMLPQLTQLDAIMVPRPEL